MPKITRRLGRAKNCPICKNNLVVDYKDVAMLSKYYSERGKIMGRARTGVCARHQRDVTRAIKRARFLALLAFSQT